MQAGDELSSFYELQGWLWLPVENGLEGHVQNAEREREREREQSEALEVVLVRDEVLRPR